MNIPNFTVDDIIKNSLLVTTFVSGLVGALGAYIVRPLFPNFSPIGIGITCALTTAIAVKALTSNLEWGPKFFALVIAYPVALILTNLIRRVSFIHPLIAFPIGACAAFFVVQIGAASFGLSLAFSKI